MTKPFIALSMVLTTVTMALGTQISESPEEDSQLPSPLSQIGTSPNADADECPVAPDTRAAYIKLWNIIDAVGDAITEQI
ncbi:MAG: hypothetical protein LBF65_00250 [Holosporales bacterium]|jgi:hypothetical protein|nr:hypothetical protein [Holosporales bacterium]